MKVWLPAIKSGTGTDIFTVRLRDTLLRYGVEAQITWFPLWVELFPDYLRRASIPAGTDIVHANGWASEAFLNKGPAVITTVHHLVHDPFYKPHCSLAQKIYHKLHLQRRDKRSIIKADTVTAVSYYVAETVKNFSGRKDVDVIYNWVNTQKYTPSRQEPSSSTFRLLLTGNQSRRKGSDFLPALARELGPRFEIRCTGGLRQDHQKSLPNIKWLGKLSEPSLIDEYQHCNAVLSLSRYEGFGYTALEGMACGKPVVGFATSGLTEVAAGTCSELVPIGDIHGLADKIRTIQSSACLQRNMGNAGRNRAETLFSERSSINNLLDLYHRTIRLTQQRR